MHPHDDVAWAGARFPPFLKGQNIRRAVAAVNNGFQAASSWFLALICSFSVQKS